MASITGSHFIALADESVNIAESSGGHLPPPIAGAFNLEVWTGSGPPPSLPAPGYNGLAVLGGAGQVTLVSGSYEVQDTAGGNVTDTLTADGDAQTIAGGPGNNDVFIVNGTGDVVIGGGQDTIDVYGDGATVSGVGNDLIQLSGDRESVDGGTGNDTILVLSDSKHDTINAGPGADLIQVSGHNDFVDGNGGNDTIMVLSGAGNDTIEADGGRNTVIVNASGNTVIGGSGNNTITVNASGNTVTGGGGNNTVNLNATRDEYSGGTGRYTIDVSANKDTVIGGSGTGTIISTANNDVLSAGTGGADTIDATGNNNTISGGTAPSAAGGSIASFGNNDVINLGRSGTVLVGGSQDTINAGANSSGDFDTISFASGTQQFVDNGQVFVDTVTGFNEAAGDRIHLAPRDTVSSTALVNGGHDTLITLSDASTILLKGVTNVTHSFFT